MVIKGYLVRLLYADSSPCCPPPSSYYGRVEDFFTRGFMSCFRLIEEGIELLCVPIASAQSNSCTKVTDLSVTLWSPSTNIHNHYGVEEIAHVLFRQTLRSLCFFFPLHRPHFIPRLALLFFHASFHLSLFWVFFFFWPTKLN